MTYREVDDMHQCVYIQTRLLRVFYDKVFEEENLLNKKYVSAYIYGIIKTLLIVEPKTRMDLDPRENMIVCYHGRLMKSSGH